jgi:hypothetical protein
MDSVTTAISLRTSKIFLNILRYAVVFAVLTLNDVESIRLKFYILSNIPPSPTDVSLPSKFLQTCLRFWYDTVP